MWDWIEKSLFIIVIQKPVTAEGNLNSIFKMIINQLRIIIPGLGSMKKKLTLCRLSPSIISKTRNVIFNLKFQKIRNFIRLLLIFLRKMRLVDRDLPSILRIWSISNQPRNVIQISNSGEMWRVMWRMFTRVVQVSRPHVSWSNYFRSYCWNIS